MAGFDKSWVFFKRDPRLTGTGDDDDEAKEEAEDVELLGGRCPSVGTG